MAPSPTGEYHVGHIATLLKNYAFAKKNHGQFVIRIEDTDQERKVAGAVERILDVIRDYGLDWDEGPGKGGPYGPYVQSERLAIYREKALELVAKHKAYYCFCTKDRLESLRQHQREAKQLSQYDGHCRRLTPEEVQAKLATGESYVIRLAVPDHQEVKFHDLIRGEIVINSDEVDDQVLLKSDGFPTYHLAVIVDDYLMKITHIMRGEEWISSTPKHILLYEAFGWEPPVYAHIPVFLNPDGKGKMSKRKGTVSARSFLDQGYLPEAMLNFFMILGWAPHDQREILSLDEYVQEFDPQDISAKSVVFDLQKLRWLNGIYIRSLSLAVLIEKLQPFLPADFPAEKTTQIVELVKERLEVLSDLDSLTEFFYRPISLDQTMLLKKGDQDLVGRQLSETVPVLKTLSAWTTPAIEQAIRSLQEQHDWKRSQYFMMIRVAITGRTATPPLFETMTVLGREETLERLTQASQVITSSSSNYA